MTSHAPLATSIRSLGILVLALAMGCADRGPPTAETPSKEPHLVGPRVVRAPENPNFHAKARLMYQGRRDDTGQCMFGHESTLKAGERVVERIAEYDPDTCMYVVEQGDYDVRSVRPRFGDSTTFRIERGAGWPSASPGPGANSLFSYSMSWISCAQQHLWFEDPLFLDVARSELHVIWEWEPSEVLSAYGSHYLDPLTTTGWYVVDAFVDKYFIDPAQVVVNGYGTFENTGFPCGPAGSQHWAYFSPNGITVRAGGTVTFSWYAYAVGPCANLLTLYRQYWLDY